MCAWAEFGFFLGVLDVFPFRAELTTGGGGVLSESLEPFLRVLGGANSRPGRDTL